MSTSHDFQQEVDVRNLFKNDDLMKIGSPTLMKILWRWLNIFTLVYMVSQHWFARQKPKLRSQTESRFIQTKMNARRGCRAFKFT